MAFSVAVLIALVILVANSCPAQIFPTDTATTFYCVTPIEAPAFVYDMSIVSPTSIWYTTKEGVFHFDGVGSKNMLARSAFAEHELEVLGVEALSDSEAWVLGHNVRNWNKSVYRFDGVRWTQIPFPQVSADTAEDLVVWRFAMCLTSRT